MGNRADFKRAWRMHRDNIMRIRREHDNRMAGLKGYAGSKMGDDKIQAEQARFDNELGAARSKFGAEIGGVLKSMSDKARSVREEVVPPTADQLAILQAVSYRQSLTMREYQQLLESCAGSSVAQSCLWDMARHKVEGGENLQQPQGDGMKAVGVLEEIQIAVRALLDWDGGTTSTTNTLSAKAGQIDPSSDDFEKKVVGYKYDDAVMAALD